MKKFVFLLLISIQICAFADTFYVLGETSITNLYEKVKNSLSECEGVEVKKEIRGVVVSVELENPEANYHRITPELGKNLTCVEYFLAKIKNPVIIEVHTDKVPEGIKGKNWEFSSVIAGNVGDVFLKHEPVIPYQIFDSYDCINCYNVYSFCRCKLRCNGKLNHTENCFY